MDNQNDFYIAKPLTFKYTFHVAKEKYDYYQIRKDLSRSLVDYSYKYRRFREFQKEDHNNNEIYFVLNDLFQRRFFFASNINVYLTDYSENRGSLIISFTVLVVGTITNYGSIRDTIDYFAEDVERLFSHSLNNINEGYSITSNIHEQNYNQSLSLRKNSLGDTNQYNALLSKIKVDRILITIILFVLILLLVQNHFVTGENTKQSETDEYKIRTIIKDEIRNNQIDEHLKAKVDTILIKAQ